MEAIRIDVLRCDASAAFGNSRTIWADLAAAALLISRERERERERTGAIRYAVVCPIVVIN